MVFDSDSKAEDGGCSSSVAPAPVAVMPNLQELVFTVPVRAFYEGGHATCDNNLGLDLECLPSLHYVLAYLNCMDAFPDDVNKTDAELRRLAQLHPNSSTLRIMVGKINVEDMMARPIHSDGEEVRTSCPTCFNNHIPFPIPLTRTSPLLYYYYSDNMHR